jgi:hypothetical protein
MQAEIQEKIKELQENLNELPMHLYILLWGYCLGTWYIGSIRDMGRI